MYMNSFIPLDHFVHSLNLNRYQKHQCDANGKTPIYWAAYYGHTEIVKILSTLTHNPNAASNNGYTPIHLAARYGYLDIVKILIPLTENINA